MTICDLGLRFFLVLFLCRFVSGLRVWSLDRSQYQATEPSLGQVDKRWYVGSTCLSFGKEKLPKVTKKDTVPWLNFCVPTLMSENKEECKNAANSNIRGNVKQVKS